MSSIPDTTSLICLFHDGGQAEAALADLQTAGVDRSAIKVIGGGNFEQRSDIAALDTIGIPDRDLEHLRSGVKDGGTILAVSATAANEEAVERIFSKHKADKIDETVRDGYAGEALAAAPLMAAPVAAAETDERSIPIVEEQLEVGKRTVDQGGVRVFRRVVEIPAEESVNLREEHVVISRNPVDRAATQAEINQGGNQVIELTETAEEAVVAKNARVVEEVVVGKQVGEHVEHIHDTVRRTEVDVEEIDPTDVRTTPKTSY